jgi:ribosomal protein L11 methyltransferase
MIRLAVRVRRAQAEIVLADLLELAPAGVEEVELSSGLVEYAVYGAPGELPALPDLSAVAGEALVEVSTSEVADDWQERWRSFHRPVLLPAPAPAPGAQPVPALRVRPPWEAAHVEDGAGVVEIVIDPGQAFGTGGHASTRLCLELLLALAGAGAARGPVLDVGTGSGVLAIAAALLGYGPVLGVDHDSESVRAAAVNAAANGVDIDVRRLDLTRQPLPDLEPGRPTIVLANLLRPLLLALPGALACAPAHLIAGGLLAHEADEVTASLAASLRLRERERRRSGEWVAVSLQTAASAPQPSGSSVAARTIER